MLVSVEATTIGAWATVGLVALGLLAIIPIVQARRARDIEILMEIGRRWDAPEMADARADVDALTKTGNLATAVCGANRGTTTHHALMREPGYLEDLGVIFYSGGISKKTLVATMEIQVVERWDVWKDALRVLGEERDRPDHFSYFREMADEMANGGSHRAHAKRARAAMQVPPTAPGRRRWRWVLAVVAALVVLGLGIGLGLTIGASGSTSSTTPTTAPIPYICGHYKNGQPGGACVPASTPTAKTLTPVEPHRVRLPPGAT